MPTAEAARHAREQALVEYGDHPTVKNIWIMSAGTGDYMLMFDLTEDGLDVPEYVLEVPTVVNIVGDVYDL